jgi:hypothetical protein
MEHQQAIDTFASERYLLDEMSDEERDAFEEHFFSCPVCADDLLAADKMRSGARAGLANATVAAAVTPASATRTWRPSIVIPWAAAAMMTIVAGYQASRTVSPDRSGLSRPLALAPMTLRAATRGEELTVTVPPGGVVTLAVDLGGAPFERRLKYEIRNPQGDLAGSGEADTPTAGAPLLLLVPSATFHAPGQYILTLHDSAGSREYRFAVQTG